MIATSHRVPVSPEFHVTSSRIDDAALIVVEGELDIATSPLLRAQLDAARSNGARRVVIDLLGVTFIDSIALASIAAARRRLGPRGGLALVVEPDGYAALILRASGLSAILECFEDRNTALAG